MLFLSQVEKVEARFIVDNNVGKLARWLRLMGYDTILFNGKDDGELVRMALSEGRVLVTRDTQILKRRPISVGSVQAILIKHEDVEAQVQQVASALSLDTCFKPFTRCLECNGALVSRSREDMEGLVPPFVFKTQLHYVACPNCGRIYWKGSHWKAMQERLEKVAAYKKNTGISKVV